MAAMPDGLRQVPQFAMIEDLSPRGALARVAKLPLDCTRGHQTLAGGEGGTCARLIQHQTAAMTGSVREVAQRALKALERDGAIRLERARVVVLGPNALEGWSDAEASRTRPGFSLADQSTLVAVCAFSVSTVIPS